MTVPRAPAPAAQALPKIGLTLTLFFTSDHHFGHGSARGLFRRPFATTAAMDAAMIARWNEVVGPDDEVWHLGDFAVRDDGFGHLE